MSNSVTIDSAVRSTATFRDFDGNLGDPGTVTATVTDPDGTVTVYTAPDVVNVSTGVYELTLLADILGRWTIDWAGTVSGPIATTCVRFVAREC